MEEYIAEEEPAREKPKEAAVFNDSSLASLGKVLATDKIQLIVFFMYMNIPTATIIAYVDQHLGFEDSNETSLEQLAVNLLKLWKQQKAAVKDREKLIDLERGLKMADKLDVADFLREKYTNGTEFTAEAIDIAT